MKKSSNSTKKRPNKRVLTMINFYRDNLENDLKRMKDFVEHYKNLNFEIKIKGDKIEKEIKDFKEILDKNTLLNK